MEGTNRGSAIDVPGYVPGPIIQPPSYRGADLEGADLTERVVSGK